MSAPEPKPAQFPDYHEYVLAHKRWTQEKGLTPKQAMTLRSDGELVTILITQDGRGPDIKRIALDEILKRHTERRDGFQVGRMAS